jgi:hypothetical protein
MRAPRRLLIAGLAVLVAAPGWAGTSPPDPDAPPAQNRAPRPPRDREAGYLDRFIRQLADGDEPEYQRLRTLHEKDPAEFRRLLAERRDRLRADRAIHALSEFPAIRDAIRSLPPEQSAAFRTRLTALLGDPPPPPGADRNDGRPRGDGDGNRRDSSARELARQYRDAADADKAAVLTELRRQLETQFEKGEEDRARMIEAVEQRLHGLRKVLDERAKNREEIINCRIEELLEDREDGRSGR